MFNVLCCLNMKFCLHEILLFNHNAMLIQESTSSFRCQERTEQGGSKNSNRHKIARSRRQDPDDFDGIETMEEVPNQPSDPESTGMGSPGGGNSSHDGNISHYPAALSCSRNLCYVQYRQ